MNPIWAVCQECLIRCSFNCEANPAEPRSKKMRDRETVFLRQFSICSAYSKQFHQFLERKTVLLASQINGHSDKLMAQGADPQRSMKIQGGGVLEIVTLSRVSLHQLITTIPTYGLQMFILLLFLFWFFSYLQLVQLFLACTGWTAVK